MHFFTIFTVIDNVQRKNTVYTFQFKSFERNNVILFQVFLRKSEKLISLGGPNKSGCRNFFEKKKISGEETVIRNQKIELVKNS